MKKLILILPVAFLLSACDTLGLVFNPGDFGKYSDLVEKIQHGTEEGIETAAESVASAVDKYCVIVPGQIRQRARDMVNAETQEGDITIACNKDAE